MRACLCMYMWRSNQQIASDHYVVFCLVMQQIGKAEMSSQKSYATRAKRQFLRAKGALASISFKQKK